MPKVEAKSSLKEKLQKSKPQEPLWDGPSSPTRNGGVTQGLLGSYVTCKERFRVKVIEGLKPHDQFNKAIEFGQMWHLAEETKARNGDWEKAILDYAKSLSVKYPISRDDISKWYNIVKLQFEIYLTYWSKQEDQKGKTNLLQETSFRVPYVLPSGRIVWLRGKWDLVDLLKKNQIWLTDHKTKGEVNEPQMDKQLRFDIQLLTYTVALNTLLKLAGEWSGQGIRDRIDTEHIIPTDQHWGNLVYPSNSIIGGFFYNVIRRPLAGGKGSISQWKPTKSNPQGETKEEFYVRLAEVIKDPENPFFFRRKVEITETDIKKFETQFLIPCLENICDDYEWWSYCFEMDSDRFDGISRAAAFPHHSPRHFRLPYGIYSGGILDGGVTDLDDYLDNGLTSGLYRTDTLFPELEPSLGD